MQISGNTFDAGLLRPAGQQKADELTAKLRREGKLAPAKAAAYAKQANPEKAEKAAGENSVYSLDISDEAKKLAEEAKTAQKGKGAAEEADAAAEKSAEETKGLTKTEVEALQSQVDQSYQMMIETMTRQNMKLSEWNDNGIGWLNFGGKLIEASRFAMPEVATTPEEAAKAIAPGGAWSVDAVSDRLFGLATAIAGNDPEKLKEMQNAIEEGFRQAGVVFKDATGQEKMPSITQETHDEITRRFDELYKNLGVTGYTDAQDETE